MRLSTSWMYQQSLSTMLSQQSSLAATQNQVDTGNRINVASDDPAGAGQVVSLNHVMAANAQYSSTIDTANTRLNTEASTLGSVNDVLDNARTLALQAVNGTLSASDRNSIASQLSQMRDQLMQLANTTDSNGNALFAGTSTTKTPFQMNANGVVSYGGNDAQQRSSVGSGLQVASSDPGSGLFMNIPMGNGTFEASAGSANTGTLAVGSNSVTDLNAWNSASAGSGGYTIRFGSGGAWSATDANGNAVLDSSGNPVTGTYTDGGSISFNGMTMAMSGTPAAGDTVSVTSGGQQDIFSTLTNMINALQSGSTTDTQLNNVMSRQIESIDQTQSAISSVQVSIGGRLDTLQQQQGAYSDLNVTYQSALSDVQGADAYTAISNLSLQQTALQASQQMFAQVKSMSLFNYLK